MEIPVLIFCAGYNHNFYKIAVEEYGFLYGARLPSVVCGPLYFADQHYKMPNRKAYMDAIRTYKPHMASVLDWEREDQLSEVLDWASEIAEVVDVVMIIPKVQNGIGRLPETINGKEVRLGYSVHTKYGGTELMLLEFMDYPVQLHGGSPGQQMYLTNYLNVKSVDGNMHMKMATQFCAYWKPGKRMYSNKWETLLKEDGRRWDDNGPIEAFRRSCKNIKQAWLDMAIK